MDRVGILSSSDGRFGANHTHAMPGEITGELAAVCRHLDIDLERLESLTRGR